MSYPLVDQTRNQNIPDHIRFHHLNPILLSVMKTILTELMFTRFMENGESLQTSLSNSSVSVL